MRPCCSVVMYQCLITIVAEEYRRGIYASVDITKITHEEFFPSK